MDQCERFFSYFPSYLFCGSSFHWSSKYPLLFILQTEVHNSYWIPLSFCLGVSNGSLDCWYPHNDFVGCSLNSLLVTWNRGGGSRTGVVAPTAGKGKDGGEADWLWHELQRFGARGPSGSVGRGSTATQRERHPPWNILMRFVDLEISPESFGGEETVPSSLLLICLPC